MSGTALAGWDEDNKTNDFGGPSPGNAAGAAAAGAAGAAIGGKVCGSPCSVAGAAAGAYMYESGLYSEGPYDTSGPDMSDSASNGGYGIGTGGVNEPVSTGPGGTVAGPV